MRESTINTRPIAECISCGSELYDGECAYLTCLGYFCAECIRESYAVCREDDNYTPITDNEESMLFGMRSEIIRIKRKRSKG